METLDLSLIVAMTEKRVIGYRGDMPWRKLPSDMARFKNITTGVGTVIMGRKTYVSILERLRTPLPGRRNIVLTRQRVPHTDNVEVVGSIDEACIAVRHHRRACVIGGGEIYNLFLPLVTRAHITTVYAELAGDTHFPELGSGWRTVQSIRRVRWNMNDEYETSYKEFHRE